MHHLLSDAQLKEAVTLFAQGNSRSHVVSHLIDTDEKLRELEATDPHLRKKLSDCLRTADPTSTQFAVKKYQAIYSLHKNAMRDALQHRYERLALQVVSFVENELKTLKAHTETLDHLLHNANIQAPETIGEYLSVLNTRNTVNKRCLDIQLQLLEKFSDILLPDGMPDGTHFSQIAHVEKRGTPPPEKGEPAC